MANYLDSRQSINRAALAAIGSAAGASLDVILADINTIFADGTGTGQIVFNNGPDLENVAMSGNWTSSAVTVTLENASQIDLFNMRFNASNYKVAFLTDGTTGNTFLSSNLTSSGTNNQYNYDLTGTAWAVGTPYAANEFAIYMFASGTAGTTAVNFATDPTPPVLTIYPTQVAVFGGTVGLGTNSTNAWLAIVGTAPSILNSGFQYGVAIQLVSNSTATSQIAAFVSAFEQANDITTALTSGFLNSEIIKGSGSTITHNIGFYDASGNGSGTNNASFADNDTFTGNWFINSSSTNPSFIKGTLELDTGLQLNGSSSGQITQIAATTTTPYSIEWPAAQGGSDTVLSNNGSGVLSWTSGTIPKAPTVQTFLSSSGTYTTPSGVLYIRVTMAGGGGAGGSGGSGGASGTAGSSSTFGSSLVAIFGSGGTGGGAGGGAGGAGGGATITTSSTVLKVVALTGGSGGGGNTTDASTSGSGGQGGSNAFGGSGGGGSGNLVAGGAAGATNTGAGGGGGSADAGASSAGGGGSGGYLQAIITSPSSTYSYTVGTGGSAGSAGANATIGGNGGSGYIVVEEFYQ